MNLCLVEYLKKDGKSYKHRRFWPTEASREPRAIVFFSRDDAAGIMRRQIERHPGRYRIITVEVPDA